MDDRCRRLAHAPSAEYAQREKKQIRINDRTAYDEARRFDGLRQLNPIKVLFQEGHYMLILLLDYVPTLGIYA